jgi:hypothetical protein
MILAPSLWKPPGIWTPRHNPRPRWRRWLNTLMSSSNGDVMVDPSGNMIEDSSGNAFVSDGAGDSSYCVDPDCNYCLKGSLKTTASITISQGSFYASCFPESNKTSVSGTCANIFNNVFKITGSADGTYDLVHDGHCAYSYSAAYTSVQWDQYNSSPCGGGIGGTGNTTRIDISVTFTSTAAIISGIIFTLAPAQPFAPLVFAAGHISLTSLYDCGGDLTFTNNDMLCGNSGIQSGAAYEVQALNSAIGTVSFA